MHLFWQKIGWAMHLFWQKIGWATFWAIYSKTHLVTLASLLYG
jgi:hypothetical protein